MPIAPLITAEDILELIQIKKGVITISSVCNHPNNNSTYFSVSSAFFSHLSTKASA